MILCNGMVHNYGTIGSYENKNDKKKYKIGIGFAMLGFAVFAIIFIFLKNPAGEIGDLMMNSKSWVNSVLMKSKGKASYCLKSY